MQSKAEASRIPAAWSGQRTNYPKTQTVHRLFEAHAGKTPNATALTFDDGQLSYRELNQKANRVAHRLHRQGVTPGTCVGLCVERSPDLMVGLLGILKAGMPMFRSIRNIQTSASTTCCATPQCPS